MIGRHISPWTTRVHDSSSSSSNENKITHRHGTELARPEAAPLQKPSRPAPAYTPPPTAQARARSRLGYTGANSALPNTTSPLGGGTAVTGIRPRGYGLDSVHNNIHNAANTDIDEPAPAVVPAVVSPPPYNFHLRDRFLETDLAATFDHTSPHPPPPAYGVASPIRLLGDTTWTTSRNRNTGTTPHPPCPVHGVARPPIALLGDTTTTTRNNRNTRGTRSPSIRSIDTVDLMIELIDLRDDTTTSNNRNTRPAERARSYDTVDQMIDLERGNPPRNETGTGGVRNRGVGRGC
ncbi:hypothetical protein B0H65DRAFT_443039 [Neurospora tetraspora]|uniref:Uncharacterized protein n=1 Tax=Neurospora tetraspora TaxID=94610 RepID=A0AAE0JGV9_9PEZI|nr:hypothetical protein B0H65DRAFT_443039 [Neurospora tetraspora]